MELGDNVELMYGEITESSLKNLKKYLDKMNIKIGADPRNETNIVYLKIKGNSPFGATEYSVIPWADVDRIYCDITSLDEHKYSIKEIRKREVFGYIIQKGNDPSFCFMASNGNKKFE